MEVIVHVGYPKTATKFFQKKYFPHIKNYKIIDLKETSSLFCDSEILGVRISHYNMNENILFSSELLISGLNGQWRHGNNFYANTNRIKMFFPDAKIVLFLREQKSIICSAYQQYIKNGGTYNLHKYIYGGKNFQFEHLLYDKVISYYDTLFGKDSVYVYLYEDFKQNPDSFLLDFNKTFGFDVSMNEINTKSINVGLRYGMSFLLRFINLFSRELIGFKYFVFPLRGVTRVKNIIYEKFNCFSIWGAFMKWNNMLNISDIEYINNFYLESNIRLSSRVGRDRLLKDGYYV